jgi:DDE family transposase
MEDKIIATYCLCDDLCQAIHVPGDPQQKMTNAEVMTTALVAALCFRGNLESARVMLKTYGYIPSMLSKSRFSRRLHALKDTLMEMFRLLTQTWKVLNTEAIYIIDSFPIAVCDNYRIPRAKLYQGNLFRGSIASKKRYFYGRKAHLMITKDGQPVECFVTHGSVSDIEGLKYFAFDLPEGSIVYGDKAYNDYKIEDLLHDAEHITLLPLRKKNSKRAVPIWPYTNIYVTSRKVAAPILGFPMVAAINCTYGYPKVNQILKTKPRIAPCPPCVQ